jgi:hypothetical protein
MTTRENPDPSGELQLIDYFYESSSGHVDKSHAVKLVPASGSTLKLIEYRDSANMYSGPRSETTETWSIERDALIDLIKRHGKRIYE